MDQVLTIASDILLGAGSLGAALYCIVLARRLKRFNNLENGVGGAVAVLSAQVDDMTRTLERARTAAAQSADTLTALTGRAEVSASKLELMMASLHDLPETSPAARTPGDENVQDANWKSAANEAARPLFSSKRRSGG